MPCPGFEPRASRPLDRWRTNRLRHGRLASQLWALHGIPCKYYNDRCIAAKSSVRLPEEKLAALEAVAQKMKIKRAAINFAIPRSTLQIHIQSDVDHRRCQTVNPERSAKLNKYIVDDYFQSLSTLLCLPSNDIHELQPMGKAVFRSFDSFAIEHYFRLPCNRRFFFYNPDIDPEVAFASSTHIQRLNSTSVHVTMPSTQTPSERRAQTSSKTVILVPQVHNRSNVGCQVRMQVGLTRMMTIVMLSLHSNLSLGSLESDDDNNDVTTPKPNKQLTEILRTPQTQPLAETKCRRKSINYKAVKYNKNLFSEQRKYERSDVQQRCLTLQSKVVFCGRWEREQNIEIIDLALSLVQ
ncbi:hypothetical protein PR048_004958 [Dryococelus australis]|uniref:HTH psq-type domain-containing protein n=1 Tax=Dryococelus australis TaxID=614101 RepID=A0ABQ9I6W2_9NEOP|nr:hypothetical protein PR048_004958 [Dryococelus australis]